jgi:hypothetical protein
MKIISSICHQDKKILQDFNQKGIDAEKIAPPKIVHTIEMN